jgi:acylphosphatase
MEGTIRNKSDAVAAFVEGIDDRMEELSER